MFKNLKRNIILEDTIKSLEDNIKLLEEENTHLEADIMDLYERNKRLSDTNSKFEKEKNEIKFQEKMKKIDMRLNIFSKFIETSGDNLSVQKLNTFTEWVLGNDNKK